MTNKLIPELYIEEQVQLSPYSPLTFVIKEEQAPNVPVCLITNGLGKNEKTPFTEKYLEMITITPKIINSFIKLLDAPHHEHFAARLNGEELEHFEDVKKYVRQIQNKFYST